MINDIVLAVILLGCLAIAYLYIAKWLEDRQAARLAAQREEFKRKEREDLARQDKALGAPMDWPKQDEFRPELIDWTNYMDPNKLKTRHEPGNAEHR